MLYYDFTKNALAQFKKIPDGEQKRIIEKIKFFLKSPNPLSFAKFIRRRDEIKVYRFRIGNWRIIFDWEDKGILITKIGPRGFKGIYK